MTRKPRGAKHHPLLSALDAAEEAIHAKGSPTERMARALVSLADGLTAILADSDGALRSGSGAQQVLDRHRESQTKRIAEIRSLAIEAAGGKRSGLSGVSGRARSATRSVVRTEVKKRRIRRGSGGDAPGGQG